MVKKPGVRKENMPHVEFNDASTNISLIIAYFQNLQQGPGKTQDGFPNAGNHCNSATVFIIPSVYWICVQPPLF